MIALKFLGLEATGLYSGFRWPTPSGGGPGPWVEVEGELVLGLNGIHAARREELVAWLDDELWLVELDGEIEEEADTILARRGRLVRGVESWDADAARDFGEACVERARHRARKVVPSLAGNGAATTAMQKAAVASAADAPPFLRDVMLYLADALELAAGGRPDSYGFYPGATEPATPGAIAANLGFVCAHTAGHLGAGPGGDAALYEACFAEERAQQLDWLEARLRVDDVLADVAAPAL
jgi:hypothetical protein